MTSSTDTLDLCAKSDVAAGDIIKVDKNDLELAVYNVEGEYFVTDDTCTHGPGSLSEGYLDGHIIECDFHGGCFDIRNGEVTAPPCMIPIRIYKIVADDNRVIINLS
ncbi:MAG: (2Fe-2S)-binding protein [Hyphomicrobiales bacterium]|nr:non-heme iron oxygenase ferredoxin subunit [Hyphomicrobiales bacterium]PCJ96419.1 MAG: (2Fe-2S)-binding protein [Hyphomicrobiales bacterium]